MKLVPAFLALAAPVALTATAAPEFLDDRFELPPGFHLYRAAGPDLAGGSYDLCFDGHGRLLVGDGNAIRRLVDKDGDGVFDSFEAIATGLGPRGPQGLLVYGDRLYAVGGDGLQLFDGYWDTYRTGGAPVPRGRLGAKFNTGGDHDAHTILRGHDGWLYFMAGNGAGTRDRRHITEASSPCRVEREASVFRVSPDGSKWECLATGGRNPPNLGLNHLGDLFSFDSDMEWHVGLPWYRPVRLNHWAIGGDQGWQDVGAYPPWYVDGLPGVLDVGRGSPTWGVFYEHTQFPEKYRGAFLVCDYRWKRESSDQYHTTGRLLAFFLQRAGAGWKATMEVLARPKPGARDAAGRLLNFALVDAEVAPDGSLFVSDHNQGVWRIFHQTGKREPPPPFPPQFSLADAKRLQGSSPQSLVEKMVAVPQPDSEWARLHIAGLSMELGGAYHSARIRYALNSRLPLRKRLLALRQLTEDFDQLPADFLASLAKDRAVEMRGQAAWLLGLRGRADDVPVLLKLLADADPFVRRRAAEAFTRVHAREANNALIERLADPERLVRYVAMTALAQRPVADWLDAALARPSPPVRLRALVASQLRGEPPADDRVRQAVGALLDERKLTVEDRLDLLRVLALFLKPIQADAPLKERVAEHLLADFPAPDRNVRWEQARLLGEFRVGRAFPRLLAALETERDEVTQLHLAQSLARLPDGWSADDEGRALRWFLGTQRGWFAEFGGKGVEFPHFWATVLAEFGERHREAILNAAREIEPGSLLGTVLINLLARQPDAGARLVQLYRTHSEADVRLKVVHALRHVRTPEVSKFLEAEYHRLSADDPAGARLQGAILRNWAAPPADPTKLGFLIYEGLFHDDEDTVRASAAAITSLATQARATMAGSRAAQAELATDLITGLMQRRRLFHPLEQVLALWSGRQRPGFTSAGERRLDDAARAAAIEFWQRWFAEQFQKKFEPATETNVAERSDEEIHKFLLSDAARGGNATRGARVYETLQCHTCHGGGAAPGREGRLFGPDLAGVTRRLTRAELADAIVYPSKAVPDRFKAFAVELKDGTLLTGFITEQNDDAVTLVDREQVHRLARSQVQAIQPQANSLMPDRLLGRATWEDIRDLLTFLDENGAAANGATGTPK